MSIRYRLQAAAGLMRRYLDVWRHFWRQRRQLDSPVLREHEAEFLPAALALQAKPVSPAGRWVARILMAMVVVVIAWASLGHIDIIVNGQGRIIASGYTKTVSSVEVARVYALHVEEGQAVRAGDILVELDTRQVDSEFDRADAARQAALAQAARCRALLKAFDGNRAPVMEAVPDISRVRWEAAASHLQDQWRDYLAQRTRLDGEIARYAAGLPVASRIEASYAELAQTNDVAQNAYLEKKQARIDIEGQLTDARNQRAALTAQMREKAQEQLEEANRQAVEATQDARKASAHGALLKLTAPVDGTVQQLAIHTVGAAVPAAQPLMQIVPQRPTVEFEASIADRDVGFVREGQSATVKIDAFEYTHYGTVPAVVSHVSRDAIQDEKRGLLYTVTVRLERPSLLIDGQAVKLTPGMSGTVDIRTGTRRVIGYVLAPLLQTTRESLHER
ncbi:HlyD family type I secretion periplasmic adaptor subunit [Paraburkholderia kururiensis]|uniref:HlyD family type I secretion periplasmic adaptor subunit n=1 Tax=Paraburkholderia kururiensis TaxID=984307 RepID=UPI000F874F1B|nr:HlyD family type I secretion periplasmic adaptor subunit [Paraburkholderia kururiensis]